MEKLKYRNILVISDNLFLITAFHQLSLSYNGLNITYACSKNNIALINDPALPVALGVVEVKTRYQDIALQYDLVFSLHCKQLFPAELVSKVKCINVHPGYNPFNRGWFPQVFSILNKLPAGATIHEIDEKLDHGHIIARREVKTHSWQTSADIYNSVQQLEVDLIRENLDSILRGTYTSFAPEEEGNVNLKKEFNELCRLDLNETVTMGSAIDKLRALTHGKYANAFFTDAETGAKVFVKITLEKEGGNNG
jgi:methionyl-tRNA formyltransferase